MAPGCHLVLEAVGEWRPFPEGSEGPQAAQGRKSQPRCFQNLPEVPLTHSPVPDLLLGSARLLPALWPHGPFAERGDALLPCCFVEHFQPHPLGKRASSSPSVQVCWLLPVIGFDFCDFFCCCSYICLLFVDFVFLVLSSFPVSLPRHLLIPSAEQVVTLKDFK